MTSEELKRVAGALNGKRCLVTISQRVRGANGQHKAVEDEVTGIVYISPPTVTIMGEGTMFGEVQVKASKIKKLRVLEDWDNLVGKPKGENDGKAG